jgi:hypothetical protein
MDVDYMAGEDDISFFESEDERWMMGDFDLDLDVDLGRPIDFEADESITNHDDSGFQDANLSSGNLDPQKGTLSVSDGTAAVPGHTSNTGLGSPKNGNDNSAQRSGGSNLGNPTSVGVANPSGRGNNANGKKEVSFQPLPNVRFSGNGNARGQPSNGSTGNGNNGNGGRTNSPNSTSSVQPSGSGNIRPSAGGFSFPPSVVRIYPSLP